ncbi:unnamed protein product, partial [Symbiodinium sp. KB8]
ILTRTETISPPWKEFVPAGASPAVDKALKIKGHKDQQRNRDYDIVQCAVDVTNSAARLKGFCRGLHGFVGVSVVFFRDFAE